MSKLHITTTVNDDPAEFLTDPGTTLLDALRDLGARIRMFQPEAMDMETAFMKLTE